jgi:hypothetical protein
LKIAIYVIWKTVIVFFFTFFENRVKTPCFDIIL